MNERQNEDKETNEKVKPKKPLYKKWWFFVIVFFLIFSAISSRIDDKKDEFTTPVLATAPIPREPVTEPMPEVAKPDPSLNANDDKVSSDNREDTSHAPSRIDDIFEYSNEEYLRDLGLYISNMSEGIKSFNNSAALMAKVNEKNTPEYFEARQELSKSALSLSYSQDILNPNIVPPPDYEDLHKKVVLSAECFYNASNSIFKIEEGTSTSRDDEDIVSQMQEGLTYFLDVAKEYDNITKPTR